MNVTRNENFFNFTRMLQGRRRKFFYRRQSDSSLIVGRIIDPLPYTKHSADTLLIKYAFPVCLAHAIGDFKMLYCLVEMSKSEQDTHCGSLLTGSIACVGYAWSRTGHETTSCAFGKSRGTRITVL
jgi:hypothetical protein